MSAAPVWLRDALLALSAAAVLIGIVELCQLARGRRRVLAGYGWETEFTHLLMNAAMAAMMTPLWSGALARTSATAIALCALLLVIVPALRRRPPAGDAALSGGRLWLKTLTPPANRRKQALRTKVNLWLQ